MKSFVLLEGLPSRITEITFIFFRLMSDIAFGLDYFSPIDRILQLETAIEFKFAFEVTCLK